MPHFPVAGSWEEKTGFKGLTARLQVPSFFNCLLCNVELWTLAFTSRWAVTSALKQNLSASLSLGAEGLMGCQCLLRPSSQQCPWLCCLGCLSATSMLNMSVIPMVTSGGHLPLDGMGQTVKSITFGHRWQCWHRWDGVGYVVLVVFYIQVRHFRSISKHLPNELSFAQLELGNIVNIKSILE